MKKLFILLLAVLLLAALPACGSGSGDNSAPASPESSEGSSEESRQDSSEESSEASQEEDSQPEAEPVKSDGFEKFSQLKIGMTEDEVNGILGEPTSVDKAYYYYDITVNGKDLEITVWINTTTGQVTYFSGDFYQNGYRDEFADSKVDFSGVDGLDTGELDTYEACASAFGTPGYLITQDEDGSTRYMWVDDNDGQLCVSFRADGSVKSYVGYC